MEPIIIFRADTWHTDCNLSVPLRVTIGQILHCIYGLVRAECRTPRRAARWTQHHNKIRDRAVLSNTTSTSVRVTGHNWERSIHSASLRTCKDGTSIFPISVSSVPTVDITTESGSSDGEDDTSNSAQTSGPRGSSMSSTMAPDPVYRAVQPWQHVARYTRCTHPRDGPTMEKLQLPLVYCCS